MAITLNGTTGITSTVITETSGGDVGVGTSSPSGKLHVAGGASNVNLYLSNDSYSSYYYQNTGGSSGVTFPASQAYIWDSGGTERMRIDSAGRVTMPYQIYFRAWSNVAYSQIDSAGVKQFGNATQRGSSYNISNGRFTAPVSGVYLFIVNMDFTSSTWTSMYLRKNGSGAGLNDDLIAKPGGSVLRNMSYMMELTANDYVEVYVDGQSYNDYIAFEGFLLG